MDHAFGVKSLPTLALKYFSISFKIYVLYLFTILFESILPKVLRFRLRFFFFFWTIFFSVAPGQFVESVSSLHWIVYTVVENHLDILWLGPLCWFTDLSVYLSINTALINSRRQVKWCFTIYSYFQDCFRYSGPVPFCKHLRVLILKNKLVYVIPKNLTAILIETELTL